MLIQLSISLIICNANRIGLKTEHHGTPLKLLRHSQLPDRRLNFGSVNVRSLENKLDSLCEMRRDHLLDILFLVETWYDSDSTCFCRQDADGQVIDKPRSRVRDDTLSQNHGGIAAISFTDGHLQPVDLSVSPTTFELLCVHVVSGTSSCFVAVIHRPGSVAVSTAFYRELGDVLDCLATYNEPVSVVGDLNLRLNRLEDPSSVQLVLVDVLADRGLSNRVTTPNAASLPLSRRPSVAPA